MPSPLLDQKGLGIRFANYWKISLREKGIYILCLSEIKHILYVRSL